jgi:hypothetical protein
MRYVRRTDSNAVFDTLMQRPDIDKAAEQYGQMAVELRAELSTAIPTLKPWEQSEGQLRSACGNDYPGITADGETRDLPTYLATTGLTDTQWEKALSAIGTVAQRYGFDPKPQRLHDAPGDHDAVFHNVHDDGSITLGTAKNTVLGVSLDCHLTAASKQRGHLSKR